MVAEAGPCHTGAMMNALSPSLPTARLDPMQRLARESVYLLTGFPLALASFVVLVTGLSVSVGLAVLWVGLPLGALTLAAARLFAELERLRLRALGDDVPWGAYRHSNAGGWRAWLSLLRDPQYWLDLLHGIVVMPLALLTWTVALVWWVGGLAGITSWLWVDLLPRGSIATWPPRPSDWYDTYVQASVNTAIGLGLLLTLPWVTHICTLVQAALGRLLLENEQVRRLQQRVDSLTASRAAAVEAEAQSLRRIERDLHDGPQQRLVRLGMDLSVAERRLANDPDAARALLVEARTQTAEALAELRALSRGIAPPILADRGLAAALASVAARCTVRAELQVAVPAEPRLPASIEHAAYFVVAEALANASKHSQATNVHIRVAREGDALRVQVQDDGIGGAHPAKGHGLAGLMDRVAAVDGTLTVSSPPGGPTVVAATLPCV